ncbi:MAG TPA: helix-turn-helix domain-containing protein [Spirochaetota bacterium]|nr:helix-turn-helix domain-containing protein [Spirochaetota bacterium]
MKGKLYGRLGIFGAVPVKILQDDRVKPNGVKAYIALSSFQGTKDFAYPSIPVIAERAGLSDRAVIDALKNLTETGWIVKKRRGRTLTNIYICMVYVDALDDEGDGVMCGKLAHHDVQKNNTPEVQESSTSYIKDHLQDQKAKDQKIAHATLRSLFEKINPQYHHDGKQAKSIQYLIENHSLKSIEATAVKLSRLVATNEKFWRDLPITPAQVLSTWSNIVAKREDAARSAPLIRARDPFLDSLPQEMIDEFVRSQPEVKHIGES